MPRTRLAGEFGKVRTGTKTDLRFCRLPVRPQSRLGPTHTGLLAEPSGQNFRNTVPIPACLVRQFMSLIGLLTATEKQVHLGRLHMRPIQWHLKNNWRVPESLEKVIPIPRSLHPHLQWWLQENNVLTGQPLQPIKRATNLYRLIKRRVGHSLKRTHCKRVLVPTRKQAAYKPSGTKSSFLALKEFQDRCTNKIVLVATDNTTVVSYINKEGGMRSGPLWALLWQILTWCTRHQVTNKARHILGWRNVVADKLSRLGQTFSKPYAAGGTGLR